MEKSKELESVEQMIKQAKTKGELIRADAIINSYYDEEQISDSENEYLRHLSLEQIQKIDLQKKELENKKTIDVLFTSKRKKLGCDMRTLALRSRVSVNIVSRIENAKPGYVPTYNKLKQLTEVLEITDEELYSSIQLNHEWVCFLWDSMNEGKPYMPIGEMLRFIREKKGYTITEVSHLCSINQPYITVLEQCKRVTTIDKLRNILKAYNMSEEKFFKLLYEEDQVRKKFSEKYNQ